MSQIIQSNRDARRFYSEMYSRSTDDILDVIESKHSPMVYSSRLKISDEWSDNFQSCEIVPTLSFPLSIPGNWVVFYTAGSSLQDANSSQGHLSNSAAGWSTVNVHTATPLASQSENLLQKITPSQLRLKRLTFIQSALGLPIKTLANVLRISRPNLYKWLDSDQDITLQENSRERLELIERVARLWAKHSSNPLSSVMYEKLASGTTVLALLAKKAINEQLLTEIFGELSDKLKAKPKSRSEERALAGFRRRPTRRSLPIDE